MGFFFTYFDANGRKSRVPYVFVQTDRLRFTSNTLLLVELSKILTRKFNIYLQVISYSHSQMLQLVQLYAVIIHEATAILHCIKEVQVITFFIRVTIRTASEICLMEIRMKPLALIHYNKIHSFIKAVKNFLKADTVSGKDR